MDKVIGYKLSDADLHSYRAHTPLNQFQHDAYHMAGEILELRKVIHSQTQSEQQLIDLMYTIALTTYEWQVNNDSVDRKDIAKWVTNTLRSCGYETMPIGSSWGVLVK